jgi:DNA-binding NarL/FixJ family response regulator
MAAHFHVIVAVKLPLLAAGIRHTLATRDDIQILDECATFSSAARALKRRHAHVLIVAAGICSGRPDALRVLGRTSPATRIALLCRTTGEFETHMLSDGAHAVLPPETLPEQLVACVRTLAAGKRWRGSPGPARGGSSPVARRARSSLHKLTPRERQIAQAVASGKRNREIADALDISPATVKLHVSRVFGKMGVRNRVGLLRKMMIE